MGQDKLVRLVADPQRLQLSLVLCDILMQASLGPNLGSNPTGRDLTPLCLQNQHYSKGRQPTASLAPLDLSSFLNWFSVPRMFPNMR